MLKSYYLNIFFQCHIIINAVIPDFSPSPKFINRDFIILQDSDSIAVINFLNLIY